ncbi:uncharacterized protein At1g65710 [Ricinus communis]|uniref:Uncharacterized protein n=1 Tax=Ricinus communis TaxID=3988 RepID=B9S5Z1_RICCO|nr:uncharacterized protein At1g65710 [Ricinus communis]EEF40900.1 conserved hypothetical protein [Ricinus communis]|eukprot:XP_002521410.1 uncharacterized protein At1g65710 [Ricinus communis]
MGCCVSTDGNSRKEENFQVGSESLKPTLSVQESRAPPPSAEEETVKEVLSETPNFKPAIKHSLQEHCVQETNKKQNHIDRKPFLDDVKKIKNQKFFQEEEESIIISEQEVSELCSLSMSETLSSTTFNKDKREDIDYDDDDDIEEVKQRVKRSPVSRFPRNQPISGDFGPRKDRVVGKSPSRRTEQSPDRRNNFTGRGGGGTGAMSLVQSKGSINYQAGRRGLRSDSSRKDPGEGSGRRSRSPAINRSTMGRCSSVRRTIGSPGRLRIDPPASGSGDRVESGTEGKWPCTSSDVGGSTTANESLENPLVSLECFIFL